MNLILADWLKSSKINKKVKNYILKMSDSDKERYFSYEKLNFGTAGIRATIGPGTTQINVFTYQQMAEGAAKHFKQIKENPSIIVAHDNRRNADAYAMIVAKVLTNFGINVWLYKDNQLKATPIVSYTIRKKQMDGAIIITASHNPKNYLGFKVYNHTGGQILPEECESIRNLMPNNDLILRSAYMSNMDLINYFDDSITDEYFEDAKTCLIKTDCKEDKNFPIVFTSHHGTASQDLPAFLERLGYNRVVCVKQQCVPDPNFTHSPISNPEDKESFCLSLKYAEQVNANVMLAVDPDSDRLAVVAKHKGEWKYLTGNEMGLIFAHYVLSNKNFEKTPFIVSTYVSTYLTDKIANHFGAKVYRTPTGFKWLGNVIEKIYQEADFVVAFEEAIGSLNSTIGRDKDGFQAAALALEIIHEYSKQEKTLVDILEKEIFPTYGYWSGETVSYTIQGANWQEEMQDRLRKLSQFKSDEICGIRMTSNKWNEEADALEWEFQNGMWVKFRLSGTEPKFKVYYNFYGESLEEVQDRLKSFKEYIS
ncbi:MAG: phospho-sugar mutase, partial [Malacoplasma sp.]|nr:phospho-sugar mutase [Malacoplasma sp.]